MLPKARAKRARTYRNGDARGHCRGHACTQGREQASEHVPLLRREVIDLHNSTKVVLLYGDMQLVEIKGGRMRMVSGYIFAIMAIIIIALLVGMVRISSELAEEQRLSDRMEDTSISLYTKLNKEKAENRHLSELLSAMEKVKGVMVAEVSYYAPTGNNTASGKPPEIGKTVAVDPEVIPLGSELYIEGIGWRTAEDTGGYIKGRRIDVFVESAAVATRGGRHRAYVILKE